MKKLILSIISFFVIASVPIVAHAVRVQITTSGTGCNSSSPFLGTPTGTAAVPIAGNYGCFTITNQGTSTARVYLNVQPTYKTLVLTNAIIKNNSPSTDTALKNITIVYEHAFGNVGANAQQYYSLGMSGFFKRGTGTALALGSNVRLEGYGIFAPCSECDLLIEQIRNAPTNNPSFLSATVSTTNSFVDPSPTLKDNFSCSDLGECNPTVPTTLEIDVFINLRGQDSLTVSSSFDSIGADNEADRDLAQALLNLPVEILSGTVNLKKNGVVPVVIYGSADYDPTHPITGIDPNTVEFMGAFEKHGHGHIEDVNGDTLPDLVLHFSVPETYLACGDSLASLTGETFDGKPIGGSAEINLKCK